MVFAQILIAGLGVLRFAVGVIRVRIYQTHPAEPRPVRTAMGVRALMDFAAGIAFFFGAILNVWQLVIVGAVCLGVGSVTTSIARRKLKHT